MMEKEGIHSLLAVTGVVEDLCLWDIEDVIPCLFDPSAIIDIFTIEKEALIKESDFLKHFSTDKKKTS